MIVMGVFVSAASSVMGASFQGLGDFPGGSFNSSASSVSDDGSVVVGSGTTASGQQAFRWTPGTGMAALGNLPDGSLRQTWANDVSADGSVIVGAGDPGTGQNKGFRWTEGGGMVSIGSLNGSTSYAAYGVSAEGSVVVGDGGQQAFRWTQSGGIQGLGFLPGRSLSTAAAVSADGSVVVGFGYNPWYYNKQAFRWTQSGGMLGLGLLPGGSDSWPSAVSPDGSVVVGTSSSSTSSFSVFRWTQSTGMVGIGNLPGRPAAHPGAVSANGSIIVGTNYSDNSNGDPRAFIWDAARGMRDLQSVLQTEYGLNLTGWILQSASGISPDGKYIVGSGTNPSGQQEAFRVFLTDPNGPVFNLSTGERFGTIQAAVNFAQSGQVIQVTPGAYRQNVTLTGKDVILQSGDPNDPNVTAETVIEGNGTDPVVKLQNGTEKCILAGLTIRGGGMGIQCSGGRPTIRGCQIIENVGSAIELLAGTQPAIDHCIIAANGGMGVKLVAPQTRGTTPVLTNCTIAQNTGCGLSGMVTMRNCILYFNSALPGSPQVVTTNSRVTYCCVQGGFAGEGNIAADPLFARLGNWTEPNDANHPAATWIGGDYHLQSQAGRWDPVTTTWVQDERTSPCVDAAGLDEATGPEPDPNGAVMDLGAYGGTVQASKSPTESVPAGSLRVTYIANEGFLLTSSTRRVLIDAIFSESFGAYAVPSSALLQKMREGQGPFGDLNVYCVTHQDGDHFSGSLVGSFLRSRPEVAFLSSQQVTNQIPNAASLGDRVMGLSLSVGQITSVVLNGVPIETMRLLHGSDPTGTGSQNLVFLIDLDGIKVLHIGDSGFDASKARFEAMNLAGRVDVLFISGYDLSVTTQTFVRDIIRPKYVIGMHLAPGQIAATSADFLNTYPDGLILQKPMEARVLTISGGH
jgi:probable HAF family extracellular repeat protein